MCDRKCSNCDHHHDRDYDNGMVFCDVHHVAVWGGSVGCSFWQEIITIW